MASLVTYFNQFPCKILSVNPPQPYLPTNPSIFHLTPRKHGEKSTFSFRTAVKCLAEQAFEDDLTVEVLPERERLKMALMSLFAGTDRGLKATSDARAHIVELVTQLEAENPNPQPTEALPLLSGKWILAYTSFHGLFPLLSSGTMVVPFVKVEEISQTIDSQDFSVQNLVQFGLPLATTCVGTSAKFEVRSPKLVQIKFEEGIIGTPKLTNSIIVPEKIEIFGQIIDLSSFKGIINTVEETASSVMETINSQSPFKFSISHGSADSWLLTSYLDEDMRISWADGGCLFILIKEGSSLSFLEQKSKTSL